MMKLERGEHLTIKSEKPEREWVPAILVIVCVLFAGVSYGFMLGYNRGYDTACDIYQRFLRPGAVARPATEEPCNGCKQITLNYPWLLRDCEALVDWWNHPGGSISVPAMLACASALSANRLVDTSEQR